VVSQSEEKHPKHGEARNTSQALILVALLCLPFLLYLTARADSRTVTVMLLGIMASLMLVAAIVG
jgi:hypothetical protein